MPTPASPFGKEDVTSTIWSTGEATIPGACTNIYKSRRVSGYFYKECPTGQSGSGIYLIVPAGKFGSISSQEEADEAARAYLAAKGPELVQVTGTCELGEFLEIFSNLTGAVNWDWVANRETDFPHWTAHMETIEYSPNNQVQLPLIGLFVYNGPVDFNDLGTPANLRTPTSALYYDLHNEHGLMHMNLVDWELDSADLVVEWSEVTAASYDAFNPTGFIPLQYRHSNYIAFLVGDFGSTEVHETSRMGGGIFELVTSRRAIEANGLASGTYFVCFKGAEVNIWAYDPMTEDYEIAYTIPFDMTSKTAFWGTSILIDEDGNFKAEIYLNGAWQIDIPDPDLLYVKPCPYMRGKTSMDYWFGDLFVGRIHYNTNRIPPVLHVEYYQPSSIEPFPQQFVPNTTQFYIPPTELVGGETGLEVNALPISLAGGTSDKCFRLHMTDYLDQISGGGQTFAQAHAWAQFDYTDGTYGLPPKFFGATALLVHQFRSMVYLKDEIPGDRRQFVMPMRNLELTCVQRPDRPFIGDYDEGDPFEFYYSNGTDLIRSPCWDNFKAADIHPMNLDYRVACDNIDLAGASWNELGVFSLEQLGSLMYKPAAGWWDIRSFPDVYSEIRTFMFKTGVAGIRTTETLEAPVYVQRECQPPVSCSVWPVLMTTQGVGGDGLYGPTVTTSQFCDSLFGGLYNVEQGGWNWEVMVEDLSDLAGDGSESFPYRYGERYLRVTISMVSAALMDSFLWSSSQLMPLTNFKEIELWAYPSVGVGSVDTYNQLGEWPIPSKVATLPLANYTLNVPPLPPSGGPGFPPEATLIYHLPIPANQDLTEEPERLLIANGVFYRFEIFDANGRKPTLDYLEDV